MSATSTDIEDIEDVEALLAYACARDTPAELRLERADGTISRCRTRLLCLADDRILTDSPSYETGVRKIPARRNITVLILVNGARYEFESVIVNSSAPVRLNEHQRVLGLALRKPRLILPSQQRAHFRVSLAAGEPIPMDLVPCHPNIRDACSIDAPIVPCRLINVSAGGLATLVPRRFKGLARGTKCFFANFTLPGEPGAFNMMVAVRHQKIIESSDCLRMGLAFLPWSGIDLRAELRRIVRFIVRRERESLRRRK